MTEQFFITQLAKRYTSYLRGIVLEQPFGPIVLRGGKNRPGTTAELHQMIKLFQTHEKRRPGNGWLIEWEEWNSKAFGRQQWPAAIKVTTEEDYLYLIGKRKEIAAFKKQLTQLLSWKPSIRNWLANKPQLILELANAWQGICPVVDYLLNHDVAGHYLRSIPVPVHTKFIERYGGIILSILHHLNSERFPSSDAGLEEALLLSRKPFLFPVRWLDENISEQLSAGMRIFAVPASYLQQRSWHIERVILVENETNLYLLPSLPLTLAICSYGKALHLLKEIGFLNKTRLFYWGDMDAQGFAMLNDIRTYYNHITSLFMDDETLSHHQAELDIKAKPYKREELSQLRTHERLAYERLLVQNLWLEQERLQQAYVQEHLNRIL